MTSLQAFRRTTYGVSIAAVLAIILVLITAHYEFGAYDLSALIDISWRMKSGQLPYRDFPSMLPPAFYLLGWAAFVIFGVSWQSLFAMNAVVYLVLLVTGWNLLRLAVIRSAGPSANHAAGLLIAFFVALTSPFVTTGHIWHSSLASMCIVTLLLAMTVLSIRFQEKNADDEVSSGMFMTIAAITAAVFLGKPNTAAPALLLLAALPFVLKPRLKALRVILALGISGFALSIGIILLVHLNPIDIARSYMRVSGRPPAFKMMFRGISDNLFPFRFSLDTAILLSDMGVSFLVLSAAVLCCVLALSLRRYVPLFLVLIAFFGCLVSATGFATNWDIYSNDIGPAAFGIIALLVYMPGVIKGFHVPRFVTAVLSLAVTAGASLLCVSRARMGGVGSWAGSQYGNKVVLAHDRFFGTLHTREQFLQVIELIDGAMAQAHTHNIFFGPRLEFEYARHGLSSPEGLPVWWHPGSSYPVAQEDQFVQQWKLHRFDLVFISDFVAFSDPKVRSRFPPTLIDVLRTEYRDISPPNSIIHVYQRQ